MIATAGSAIAHMPIVQDVTIEILKEGTKDIDKIAEFTRNAYLKARNKKLEEEVLFPFGMNLQTYYQLQGGLDQTLTNVIVQNMAKYNYQLWMILAGVDEKGGHIYRLESPGKVFNFDSIGYHAIGSGELHAMTTFIANNFHSGVLLKNGLAIAFEAKKRSEKAQGVGPETDMYIVTKEKVIHLPTQAVTDLDAMYQTRLAQERKVVSEVEKMITELDMMKYIDSGPEKPPEQPKSS
ncbi:MAG: hypothetical protein ABSB56_05190 [Nitrososphaerales archaeon]|jgi:hypothetical protein